MEYNVQRVSFITRFHFVDSNYREARLYIYIYACMYMCVYVYVCVYICLYVCMYGCCCGVLGGGEMVRTYHFSTSQNATTATEANVLVAQSMHD